MKSLALIGVTVVAGGVVLAMSLDGSPQPEAPVSTESADQTDIGARSTGMTATEALAAATLQPPPSIVGHLESRAEITEFFNAGQRDWARRNRLQWSSTDPSDCPGQTAGSPERTLYVRYVTTYPDNPEQRANLTYTDIEVPSFAAGEFRFQTPLITEQIVRDRHEWKRRYKVSWSEGVDQAWLAEMREERERMDEQIRLAQDESPARANRLIREALLLDQRIKQQPVTGMNEQVTDQIEVDVPPPGWSFRYDNHAGTGQPLFLRENKRRRPPSPQFSADLIDVLAPIRDFGEQLESGTQRTILGYTCEVTRSADWDAEHCVSTIEGQRVVLFSRLDKAHTEAVYLDPAPCVPLAQFTPPAGIRFAE